MQFYGIHSCIIFVLITYVYHNARFKKRKGLFVGFILATDHYYAPYDRTVGVAFLLVQISLRSTVSSVRPACFSCPARTEVYFWRLYGEPLTPEYRISSIEQKLAI